MDTNDRINELTDERFEELKKQAEDELKVHLTFTKEDLIDCMRLMERQNKKIQKLMNK